MNCVHHKWLSAIWLDLDICASLDVEKIVSSIVDKLVDGDIARCALIKLPHSAMRYASVLPICSAIHDDGAEIRCIQTHDGEYRSDPSPQPSPSGRT